MFKLIEGYHLTQGDKQDIKFLLQNKEKLNKYEFYKVRKGARKTYNLIELEDGIFQVTIHQKTNEPWGFDYTVCKIQLLKNI